MKKEIHVSYFAILREQRGLGAESLETSASTARELFAELANRYKFSLPLERLRVAINGEFAPWDAPLSAGAKVALIPPVAGG